MVWIAREFLLPNSWSEDRNKWMNNEERMTRMTEGNFYFTKRLHSTDRCYVAVRLFSSRSQMISRCSKTWVSHWAAPCVPFFLFLLRVDVISHLLLDRSTATWNLFVSHTWILIGFCFWYKGDSSIVHVKIRTLVVDFMLHCVFAVIDHR